MKTTPDTPDDLTPEEREAERRFLRPINPDPVKTLADWHRKTKTRKGSDGK